MRTAGEATPSQGPEGAAPFDGRASVALEHAPRRSIVGAEG